jgi:hypothetical protein
VLGIILPALEILIKLNVKELLNEDKQKVETC